MFAFHRASKDYLVAQARKARWESRFVGYKSISLHLAPKQCSAPILSIIICSESEQFWRAEFKSWRKTVNFHVAKMSNRLQCALFITALSIVFFADQASVCLTHDLLHVFIFRVYQGPRVQVEQKEARVTRLAYNSNNNNNVTSFLSHIQIFTQILLHLYCLFNIYSIFHTRYPLSVILF